MPPSSSANSVSSRTALLAQHLVHSSLLLYCHLNTDLKFLSCLHPSVTPHRASDKAIHNPPLVYLSTSTSFIISFKRLHIPTKSNTLSWSLMSLRYALWFTVYIMNSYTSLKTQIKHYLLCKFLFPIPKWSPPHNASYVILLKYIWKQEWHIT